MRAAASCAKAAFLSASAASIFSPYVGDSERAISELFHRARSVAPAVLFMDEIDSLVGSREGRGNGVKDRVLSTLLNEMDGIGVRRDSSTMKQQLAAEGEGDEEDECVGSVDNQSASSSSVGYLNDDVFVVCATNRPDVLDSALCRPGRLDHLIRISPPEGIQAKAQMLRHFTSKMPLALDLDLNMLAGCLPESVSGAEVENLCKEAAIAALTRGMCF